MAWSIGNSYPYIEEVDSVVDVFQKEYPEGIWKSDGDYPYYQNTKEVVDVLLDPLPTGVYIQEKGKYPSYVGNKMIPLGAFTYATNLKNIKIPKSVKYIGEWAFRYTSLTEVTIAKDCKYYPTSFPDNCRVSFYEN